MTQAQKLFLTQGYEETSVQQIIDACGIAKGTFYHYFSTKGDLLNAVIEDWGRELWKQIAPLAENPQWGAVEKLNQIFKKSRLLKSTETSIKMMRFTLEVFYSPSNIQVRHRLIEQHVECFSRVVGSVLRQGMEEGVFRIPADPEQTAEMIIRVGLERGSSFYEEIIQGNYKTAFEKLEQGMALWSLVVERVLELPSGTLEFWDTQYIEKLKRGLK